eukprot:CAMPEP_0176171654 /NCGR_PEP_ID=MMETSP0120_2-20121206/87896_1 /TAXON_ID=160619 /ORGANISM="Kryptoperidinium foliaceum, Strain CCMP 1326" /LENGTH=49 /DNA_ID= /DNA_START= /DNA_END= /DNA_ORIENTATION=
MAQVRGDPIRRQAWALGTWRSSRLGGGTILRGRRLLLADIAPPEARAET